MKDAALRTFVILTIGACGMAALLALLPAAGHDQMWLLYAARLVLGGAPLYGPQVFETNPPLIVWLSMVPEGLSGVLHVADTALGKLFVLGLMALVGWLCLRLLREGGGAGAAASRWWLGFCFVTVFAVMPARDFGQRDHFLILFLFPYVFAAGVRLKGAALPFWLGFGVGAMALLGVVLKPHQLLVVLAVEGALVVWRRSARQVGRAEIVAMFVAGLVFLGAVFHFAPYYFSVVAPQARDTYWAYGKLTVPQLLWQAIELHVLAAVVFWLAWRGRLDAFVQILLVAGTASTLAYYLQGTGWYYQQLPALSFFSFALALLLRDRLASVPGWTPVAAGGLVLLALGLTTHFMDYPFTADRSFPIVQPDASFFTELQPGTPVMTISPTIDDTIMPVYKYHLTLGQRYPAFLLLPALLRSEEPQGEKLRHVVPPAALQRLDQVQRNDMLEDLARWQPELILVERCQDEATRCQVLEDRHDDLLAWFMRDARFQAAFGGYRFWKKVGPYDGYVRVR